jgi:hypothetical protein
MIEIIKINDKYRVVFFVEQGDLTSRIVYSIGEVLYHLVSIIRTIVKLIIISGMLCFTYLVLHFLLGCCPAVLLCMPL